MTYVDPQLQIVIHLKSVDCSISYARILIACDYKNIFSEVIYKYVNFVESVLALRVLVWSGSQQTVKIRYVTYIE